MVETRRPIKQALTHRSLQQTSVAPLPINMSMVMSGFVNGTWDYIYAERKSLELTVPSGQGPAFMGRLQTSAAREQNKIRRRRIIDIESLPRTSVTNMIAAVGTFERWLWSYGEGNVCLSVCDIPPHELDSYLVDFFATVTNPNGGDYTYESFQTLRCHLTKYLKVTGYPARINNSHQFYQSHDAYRKRLTTLVPKINRVTEKPDNISPVDSLT